MLIITELELHILPDNSLWGKMAIDNLSSSFEISHFSGPQLEKPSSQAVI